MFSISFALSLPLSLSLSLSSSLSFFILIIPLVFLHFYLSLSLTMDVGHVLWLHTGYAPPIVITQVTHLPLSSHQDDAVQSIKKKALSIKDQRLNLLPSRPIFSLSQLKTQCLTCYYILSELVSHSLSLLFPRAGSEATSHQ